MKVPGRTGGNWRWGLHGRYSARPGFRTKFAILKKILEAFGDNWNSN
jgi:hypothetical protein